MVTLRNVGMFASVVAVACVAQAADRTEVTFADGRIFAESLTSTKDGTLYIPSLGHSSVYRATPESARAEVWIQPTANGLQEPRGVLPDEATGVLWICNTASAGRGGAPPVGETAVMAFNLRDASFRASYPFPGGGFCNDIAIANDGTVYATDFRQARILRLKKGAAALDVWAADAATLDTVDGIALLADGSVYATLVGHGALVRIPVNRDGSAGPLVRLEASRPLMRPDGMRSVGNRTLLVVETVGVLAEVTIDGDKAQVKTLREGLTAPTGVTFVGGMAYVSEARLSLRTQPGDPGPFRVVGVPYRAPD